MSNKLRKEVGAYCIRLDIVERIVDLAKNEKRKTQNQSSKLKIKENVYIWKCDY